MPGPDPKYTPEERAKQGNPGRRPKDVAGVGVDRADFFPDPPTDAPPPPGFLHGETLVASKAVEIWYGLIEYVMASRVYRDGDAVALGRLCRYLAEWDEYTRELDNDGMFITDHNGMKRRHPALLARKSVEESITALEKQFGLQPGYRLALTKSLAGALKDLPLVGKQADGDRQTKRGPVGFLKKD